MNRKLIIPSIILFASAVSAASCGKNSALPIVEKTIDIVMDQYRITLGVNDSFDVKSLNVRMDNYDGTPSFAYESTDPDIAYVDNDGIITAKAIGTAVIKISFEDYQTLLQVTVQKETTQTLLTISLNASSLSLYEGDTYAVNAVVRKGGEAVNASVSYDGYDASVLSVDSSGIITAVSAGHTLVNVNASYEGQDASVQIDVTVSAAECLLSCEMTSNEIYLGDGDFAPIFKLIKAGKTVATFTLSEVSPVITSDGVAVQNGDYVDLLKIGYFTITASAEHEGKTYKSTTSYRVRDIYHVTYARTGEVFDVKDGEYANEHPESFDSEFVFENWLYEGKVYDEPIYQDMEMDVSWASKSINFTHENYDAYCWCKTGTRGATADAVSGSSDDELGVLTYYPGFNYYYSENPEENENPTADNIGHLMLPAINYRKYSEITYTWTASAYIWITDAWYSNCGISGTVRISVEKYNGGCGYELFVTVSEDADVPHPFGDGSSMKGQKTEFEVTDADIVCGYKNLEAFTYWSCGFDLNTEDMRTITIGSPHAIYNEVDPLYPDFSSKTYGAEFKCLESDIAFFTEPTVKSSEDHQLVYCVDKDYEGNGSTHKLTDFEISLPRVNIAKIGKRFGFPFSAGDGFHLGLSKEESVGSDVIDGPGIHGYIVFDDITSTSATLSIEFDDDDETMFTTTVTDTDVLKGNKSVSGLYLGVYFCFYHEFRLSEIVMNPHI